MKRKTFSIFASVYCLLFCILGVFWWWTIELKPVSSSAKEAQSLEIKKGEGVSKIASVLKQRDLIRSPLAFKIWVTVTGLSRRIKAGTFYLSPSMTTPEIASLLVKGETDQWLTIVEGLRAEQIGELLVKEGYKVNLPEWNREIVDRKLEGQLFPDSYLLPKSATQGAILQIIGKNFQKKVVVGLAKELAASNRDLNFVLTMASLVEREAKTPEDRSLVAGILLKRLSNNWALGVDATVQYVVASQNCSRGQLPCDWWPQKLTAKDLQIDSPFNTYLNVGLPPHPICNPGLSSIKAVLEPKDSPYWYYLSDKNGTIHYAKTAEEQENNRKKYLLSF